MQRDTDHGTVIRSGVRAAGPRAAMTAWLEGREQASRDGVRIVAMDRSGGYKNAAAIGAARAAARSQAWESAAEHAPDLY